MAPNTRRLIGIALLVTAVAYGLYRQLATPDEVSADASTGRTGQPAD